jgi:hypothetical protein
MKKLFAALLIATLMMAAFTVIVDMDQSADAMKAKKKSTRNHHAHYVGGQVCGDELCKDSSPYIRKIR